MTDIDDLFVTRPAGTLEDAIAAADFPVVTQWAKYLRGCQQISLRTVIDLGRVVEDIGYALTGHRYEESESVWNAAAEVARAQGNEDHVREVEATYQVNGFHPIVGNSKGFEL